MYRKKKALGILETLLSVVLSTIVLIIIIQQLFSFLLYVPENKKIAEDNAKSLIEFVNSFSEREPYNSHTACTGQLKWHNLENFQANREPIYSYLITEDGMYLISSKSDDLKRIIEEKGDVKKILGEPKKKFSFPKKLTLYEDKTSHSWLELEDVFFLFDIISNDNALNIEELPEDSFYLITPNLDSIKNFGSNQNDYNVKLYKKEKYNREERYVGKEISGKDFNFVKKDLVLKEGKVESEGLFMSKKVYSSDLSKLNLCFFKHILEISQTDEIFNSQGKNIAYNNYKISFTIPTNEDGNVLFTWVSKPTCQNEEICRKYLGEDYGSLSYKQFREKVFEIFKKNEGLEEDFIKTLEFEELTLEEIKRLNQKVNFYDVLDILREDEAKIYLEGELAYDISKFFNGRNMNGCRDTLCNRILYKDGKIYFYIEKELDEEEHKTCLEKYRCSSKARTKQTCLNNCQRWSEVRDFASFDESFLRKKVSDNNEKLLIFNGEEIQYEIISADREENEGFGDFLGRLFSLGGSDNKDFYLFSVNLHKEDKKIETDIILSPIQVAKIGELKGEET